MKLKSPPRPNADWQPIRERLSRCGLAVGLLISAAIFASAVPGVSEHYDSARAASAFAAPRLTTTNIEDIRVGDRVLADNPDVDSPSETAVDPATWRKLRLRAIDRWEDGTINDINVETLQTTEWLREHNVSVGAWPPLPLDLDEMGLTDELRGEVTAIEPCPPIRSGPGRVVLTTVNHINRFVLELTVRDEHGRTERICPTGFHKFYTIGTHAWLSAEDLCPGDLLQGQHGVIFVASSKRRPGNFRVYNFTVEGEHVYSASQFGVLVHNTKCYRNGSATDGNLTPRPNDTEGLSTFDTLEAATPPGGKAQVIDPDKLDELIAEPTGPPGHIGIRPKDPSQLQEWIDSRGSSTTHPLTQEVRDAIVGEVRRPKK
jgi:hypothetical protein